MNTYQREVMMIVTHFLAALIVALLFSGILVRAGRRKGPRPLSGAAFIFLIILFITWALAAHASPANMSIFNLVLYLLVIGLLVSVFLAVLIPRSSMTRAERRAELNSVYDPGPNPEGPVEPKRRSHAGRKIREEESDFSAGPILWILMVLLVAVIAAAYI